MVVYCIASHLFLIHALYYFFHRHSAAWHAVDKSCLALIPQPSQASTHTAKSKDTKQNHHHLFPSRRCFPPPGSLRQVFQVSVCIWWKSGFGQHAKQAPSTPRVVHCNVEVSFFTPCWTPGIAKLEKKWTLVTWSSQDRTLLFNTMFKWSNDLLSSMELDQLYYIQQSQWLLGTINERVVNNIWEMQSIEVKS